MLAPIKNGHYRDCRKSSGNKLGYCINNLISIVTNDDVLMMSLGLYLNILWLRPEEVGLDHM